MDIVCPDPAQPDPAQPDPAQPDPAQPDPAPSGAPAAPGRRTSAATDMVIRDLAARQHGVVGYCQLRAEGIPARTISYRVTAGALVRLHPRVFRAGVVAAPREPLMAAVLLAGDGAALTHRSAALVAGIIEDLRAPPEVNVAVGQRGRGTGVRLRRMQLLPDEVTVTDGLPVTVPARTLLDLAGIMGMRELEDAVATALRKRLVTLTQLRAMLERHRSCRGYRRLRAVLGLDGGPAFSRSKAEALFRDIRRSAELPAPGQNVKLMGFEVDSLWPRQRVVVEIDGYEYHWRRRAFEGDRRRDAILTAAGYRVLRFTWLQLKRQSPVVIAQLAAALALGGAEADRREGASE